MKEPLLQLVEQLKSDRRLASFDEAATKQIVLLQILSLLGWDIHSIDEVVPEYAVGSQRVDYSLRNSGANKAFVEVKRVGEDLERHQEQLLNYSFKEGVRLAVLTNGISWRFYLPLLEGSWEQRKFYTIEIYDQDSKDIVDRFVDYLEKENVCSGKSIQIAEEVYKGRQKEYLIKETLPKAWNKLISEPDELLIELIADATEKLCGFKPDSLIVESFISSGTVIEQIPVETPRGERRTKISIDTKGEGYKGKSVNSFIFCNTSYEVKYWIDVLTQVCKIIYNLHPSDFDRVLQLKGRNRPYYTRNPNELRVPQRVEVKMSLDVISLFGYSGKDFSVITS